MKNIILLSILILTIKLSFSQQTKIDSLKNEFAKAKTDTSKINLAISISWQLMEKDLDSAFIFADTVRSLIKNGSPKFRSNYFNTLAIIYARKYKLDSALYYFNTCVKEDRLSANYKNLIDDYLNIANVYNISAQNDSALYFFKLSENEIKTYPEIVSKKQKAVLFYNIALAMKKKSDYINSIKYSIKAEKIFKQIGEKYGEFLCLENKARIWGIEKQPSKAFECLKKITILGFPKENEQKAEFYKIKANLYVNIDSLDKGKEYYNKAIDFYIKSKNKLSAFLVYGNMLKLNYNNDKINSNMIKNINKLYYDLEKTKFTKYTYFNYIETIKMLQNKNKKALQYNDSALLYCKNTLDKYYESKNRGLILSKLGRYKEGYPFIKNAISLQDSVFSLQIKEKINELSIKYETEKKEQKLVLQKKELIIQKANLKSKQKTIWSIVVASLLLLSGGLTFYFQKLKTEKQKRELLRQKHEKQILKLQVEAQDKTKQEISSALHTGIGSELVATILNLENKLGNSKETQNVKKIYNSIRTVSHILALPNFIESTIEEEINNLVTNFKTDNLEIELGIFSKIGWNDIDPFLQQNIYRIVQELFSNTMKHAKASQIQTQLIRHNDFISLSYEDNGKGYNPQEVIKNKGYQNEIISRTQVLKGSYTDDSQTNKGTILTFRFPL